MPYLVDGHNLIPKIGLRLDSFDDEEALVQVLQEFCRLRRAMVEVYFDGAPPGQKSVSKAGAVTAHFVRAGSSADAAIEHRLSHLGKQARNWTVVSSDARIQTAGRSTHARVISSEEFARLISASNKQAVVSKREKGLSQDEVNDWLVIFKNKKE